MADELRLGQLLCSRLCHDLAGPAGAVGAGLELLAENANDVGTRALLTASSARLTRSLAFFRTAFGLRGGRLEADLEEARMLAADFLADGKVTLAWPKITDGMIVRADLARLVLVLIHVAHGMLPRGGTIRVNVSRDGDGGEVLLDASGRGANLPAPVIEALDPATPVEMLTARNVHAHFARREADALGADLSLETPEPECVRMVVRLPAFG